jgi:hypothetical protein
MALANEEAVKATQDWLKDWIAKRPEDPRDWVLRNANLFREALAKGLDAQGLHDYLEVAIKVDRSTTYCKGLLKELKKKVNGEPAK